MQIEEAAKCLAELGHPTRLKAFRLLVRAAPAALPVKDIQAHLDIPNSTLSHHLSHLISAGLITQTREGRILHCQVRYPVIREVLEFLMKDCCAGIVRIHE